MRIEGFDSATMATGIFQVINFLLLIFSLGISIYCLILFIKLAIRGIKALNTYIEKNK